jgi:Fic family protein
LLITFLLCERNILLRPLLYLSHYLKAHRAEYYDRLTAIRNDGDWEGWLRFFLRGVYEVSISATETARRILSLREEHRQLLSGEFTSASNSLTLHDRMFKRPTFSVNEAKDVMGCAYGTANAIVEKLEKLGLLREITGQDRNRRYQYEPYVRLFASEKLNLRSDE